MKKLILISIIILAFVLSGCNLPGFQSDAGLDPDDAMATEIARILTGTPIQIEATATPADIDQPETPEETEEIQPTEPEEELPEPEEPVETEAPTATPEPTDTPMPAPTATLVDTDPTRNLGDPDWVDNMNNGDNWPTGLDKYTAIKFENGFMKLTVGTDVDGWRVTWPTIGDFYLETTLQSPECEGNDHFGLIFRVPADSQAGKGYLFGITCDGQYSLRRWDGSVMHSLVSLTAHDAIEEGPDVVNKLGIMARGANLALYINGQKVREVSDSNYLEGRFGIFVGGINVEDLTVWVDQIRYWDEP
jgi:hypothetical protein